MGRQMPQKTEFQWGARSALQKGIRRGDLGMTAKAVSVLFETEPSWIFWRLPAIIPEEAWPMGDSMARTLKEAKRLFDSRDLAGAEKMLREALCEIASLEKDRDPNGLAMLLTTPELRRHVDFERLPEERKRQWKLAGTFIAWKEAGLQGTIFEKMGVLKDKAEAFESVRRRFLAGGMDGDRSMLLCYCAMMLTTPEAYILKKAEKLSKDYTGGNRWPWYVYDMHTLRGKRALEAVVGRDLDQRTTKILSRIWFAMESGKVNALSEKSFWWPLYLKIFEEEYRMTPQKWEAPNGLRDRLRKAIEG